MVKVKHKSLYVCQQCGYETPKWLGKCPDCEQWSTFQEEIRQEVKKGVTVSKTAAQAIPLLSGDSEVLPRISTGIRELDRTLGGGVIPGVVVMIGGDPGIGKSTLMLQMLDKIDSHEDQLYISGEESKSQVHLRARRLGLSRQNILFSVETSLQRLLTLLEQTKPAAVVIDSIQTLNSEEIDSIPGNVSQLRTCTAALMRFAKEVSVPVFLIGHVTKEGSIAGPRVLEHMVDTVLYFEGDQQYDYRILRSTKNRFGPVNEIGLFQMTREGLEGVANPSEVFLSSGESKSSGNAVVAIMEGNRPFLVQVQALVTKTQFGMPQRTASGIDHRRMNLLLAVLEKRYRKPFGFHDVFIKIAGGLRIDEPAADLGVCMALVSSLEDKMLPEKSIYIGEVGLGGEIRGVNRIDERINEALKLGFEKVYIPKRVKVGGDFATSKLVKVGEIGDLVG
jgi:DNA repair protein RadA/Sms